MVFVPRQLDFGSSDSSIMYRYHPAVKWTTAYPHRDVILKNTQRSGRFTVSTSAPGYGTKVDSVTPTLRLLILMSKVTHDGSSTATEDEVFDGVCRQHWYLRQA